VARNSENRAPVAAHRLSPRGWTRVVTFLAVFAVSGGAAYASVWYLDRTDGTSWWSIIPGLGKNTPHVSVATYVAPSASPSASPTVSVTHNYDFSATVSVFNDSGDGTLASAIATLLQESTQFTSVDTRTWDGPTPPANSVRFENPDLADTAQLIADTLGIQTVNNGPTGGPDIAVILVTDPRAQPKVTPSPSTSATP
jgi:hypothetical protein